MDDYTFPKRSSRSGTHQPQPDPHSALINQIQTGIKLRKSVFGTRLFDSTCTREDTSQQNSTNFAANPSIDYTYVDSIETCSVISGDSSSSGCHSNSSFSNSTTSSLPPQTLPKPGSEVKKKITKDTNIMPGNASNPRGLTSQPGPLHIDISQLPGYQPVPSNCPTWKSTMIEKKNNQVETDAKRQMLAQYEEEDRWKDIPEWKKTLIIEKEKRKQDDEAPLEAERRKREEEITRLQSLPEWKRDLIMKKRGDL